MSQINMRRDATGHFVPRAIEADQGGTVCILLFEADAVKYKEEILIMIIRKLRMLGLAAAVVLPAGLATPAFADQDDGWFWGRGMMGQWFRAA
jgi:hypothetical protein